MATLKVWDTVNSVWITTAQQGATGATGSGGGASGFYRLFLFGGN